MKELLSKFPYTALPITGQLIFLTVFLGVVLWTYRRNSTKYYDYFAAIPLQGDDNE